MLFGIFVNSSDKQIKQACKFVENVERETILLKWIKKDTRFLIE